MHRGGRIGELAKPSPRNFRNIAGAQNDLYFRSAPVGWNPGAHYIVGPGGHLADAVGRTFCRIRLHPNQIMNDQSGSYSAVTTSLPKHLKRLESESIEIMREVAAEFKKPVMLYSIGKDSSVMLHL